MYAKSTSNHKYNATKKALGPMKRHIKKVQHTALSFMLALRSPLLLPLLPLLLPVLLTGPALERVRNSVTSDELVYLQERRKVKLKEDPDVDPIYTAATLLRKELPAIKWAVQDILPEGLTILAGKPKMGKSWFALGLGVAIATGGVAMGNINVDAGDVLYLALEDNERRMQTRLRAVLQLDLGGSMLELPRLSISHTCPRIGQGAEEFISSWLAEHPEARMVVIDVLARIRPTRRHSGSGYNDDYSDIEPLQRLASEYGIAILVLTHLRKEGASDPLDTLNATLGLTGAADNVLALVRNRGQADAVLVGAGRDITEVNLALRWDAETCLWSVMGDADKYRISAERKEIIEVLRKINRAVQPKDIYPLLPHKSEEAVRKLMSKMVYSDDLIVGENGKYCINTKKHPIVEGV